MIARLPGTMNAAPTPWAARSTISVPLSGASAQASDMRTNSAMPAPNTRLTPNTSPAAPPSRTSADRNSM